MYFTKLTTALALATTTLAVPLTTRQEDNSTTPESWQVTRLNTYSPSGRPGSDAFSFIRAEISDPNTVVLGQNDQGEDVTIQGPSKSGLCEAIWFRNTKPFDHIWPCTDGSGNGYWYMEILEKPDFFISDFQVRFTRRAETINRGAAFRSEFNGVAAFKVGDNMSGSCGGSGVCSWGLKQENNPFPVEFEEVEVDN